MKVLVGCEYSGIVREAFKAKGHDAWSCDILPTEIAGNHYQCDIREVINDNWDIIIGFPPCTYLANSGLHYLKTQQGRMEKLKNAFDFVKMIWSSCDKVAIENPIGWLNTNWQKPTQIIQPYQFGHPEIKTTCLWLKNLPPLLQTEVLPRPNPNGHCIRKSGKNAGKVYNYYFRQGKSAKHRAKTFPGVAKAMATQWTFLTPQ